ncbi:hypothetical protein D3C78_1604430 [compost metagenome]
MAHLAVASSILFAVAGTVVIQHPTCIEVIAGTQLYRTVVIEVHADKVRQIAGLIAQCQPLPPSVMHLFWVGGIFLEVLPVVFQRQFSMAVAEKGRIQDVINAGLGRGGE